MDTNDISCRIYWNNAYAQTQKNEQLSINIMLVYLCINKQVSNIHFLEKFVFCTSLVNWIGSRKLTNDNDDGWERGKTKPKIYLHWLKHGHPIQNWRCLRLDVVRSVFSKFPTSKYSSYLMISSYYYAKDVMGNVFEYVEIWVVQRWLELVEADGMRGGGGRWLDAKRRDVRKRDEIGWNEQRWEGGGYEN